MMGHQPVVVIGAGPAGLTAAYELIKRGVQPVVLEKADKVGGLARTEVYKGYRFDIGGHRFFTKHEEIQQLWGEMLGRDLLKVSRLSRIHYQDRFINYPLDPSDTLSKLSFTEGIRILLSYVKARVRPGRDEGSFEQWAINRFGRRLYETFFQAYTEKVWGMPCHEIRSDWAGQRINGLSMVSVLSNALFGTNNAKTLINEFHYPVLGPGMMWQRFQEAVESASGQVRLCTQVVRLERDGGSITGVLLEEDGRLRRVAGDHFISTMPLTELVARIDPLPPQAVVQAGRRLRYRDFILVGLIANHTELFPDQWIYVHSPEVRVGRIQNFRNWSAAMVPDPQKTSLGAEYFCTQGDDVWTMSEAELIEMATRELADLGLLKAAEAEDGMVIRQPKAYPVYDQEYHKHLEVIRRFLATLDNLQSIGRGGMHRYNNMDHSMITGMLAARNLVGKQHDLRAVNTERSFREEVKRRTQR